MGPNTFRASSNASVPLLVLMLERKSQEHQAMAKRCCSRIICLSGIVQVSFIVKKQFAPLFGSIPRAVYHNSAIRHKVYPHNLPCARPLNSSTMCSYICTYHQYKPMSYQQPQTATFLMPCHPCRDFIRKSLFVLVHCAASILSAVGM